MSNLDERHLEDELQTKVPGARVVYVVGVGYFALIPHYRAVGDVQVGTNVGTLDLGRTYKAALEVLRATYHTQPVD